MKPSKRLIEALRNYYYNCSRQYKVSYSNESASGYKVERNPNFTWNKDADSAAIFLAAKQQGFTNNSGCASTFWFGYKTKSGKTVTFETDSNQFPSFTRSVKPLKIP